LRGEVDAEFRRLESTREEFENNCRLNPISGSGDEDVQDLNFDDRILNQKSIATTTTTTKVGQIPQMRLPSDDLSDLTPLELSLRQTIVLPPTQEVVSMQNLIQERSEAVLSINKSLGELKNLFEDVNTLVFEQQEVIDKIENNAVIAHDATDVGMKELEEALRLQKKSTCVVS
jgi:hypothetical protein